MEGHAVDMAPIVAGHRDGDAADGPPGTELWTKDKRLRGVAVQWGLAAAPPRSRGP